MQFFGIDNVAISNGETWKKQRRIMNPAFHRAMPVKTMSSVVPDLFSFIEKEFSSSSNDEVIVPTAMKNFTLDVLGLTVFGNQLNTILSLLY
jgi:cytochrome P450